MISPTSRELLKYYPEANRAGTANNLQLPSANTDNVDQVLARVDQNLGNKIRLNVRYNWHDSFNANIGNAVIPVTAITQPRVNKNWLFSYTHTLRPNLLNDFRIGYHRIDFDTVNPFYVSGPADAGTALGIPGFNGDTAFNNPGLPSINVSNFNGLGTGGTNWFQFDTTFQLSNVLAYNRGSHNIRSGFDLRRLATGRRAANDPRGLFNFTGDISGYSVADFMLGLPRTVIPPTDQIQGHVGGWRNGFFVNDTWQASRNLTLNIGLRYEATTPVQTYEGLASMLAENFETIIPSTFPSKGFEFTEANYDFGPRLGATYRIGEKTVVRAGFGMYYNPNQMNSFTFLTNNPPLAAVTTYTSDPANPTLSFSNPTGPVGPAGRPDMISPTRELPNARKDQWSFDVQRELGRGTALDFQYVGSNTSHLDRSFFNNTPTPGPGAIDPRRPSQTFRSRRIIQNDLVADYDALSIILRKRMNQGIQFDAHYTYSRTKDMATHSNGGGADDGQLRHLARLRPGELGYPAPVRRELPLRRAVSQGLVERVPEVHRGRLAGVGRHDDPEWFARQHHLHAGPREHRHHRPAAAGPRRRGSRAQLPAELERRDRSGEASADQLLRRDRVRAAGAVHLRQHVPERPARTEVLEHRPVVHEERASRRDRTPPGARRDLQHLQPGQLRQSQRVVRRGDLWHHYVRRFDASVPTGREAAVLVDDCQELFTAEDAEAAEPRYIRLRPQRSLR